MYIYKTLVRLPKGGLLALSLSTTLKHVVAFLCLLAFRHRVSVQDGVQCARLELGVCVRPRLLLLENREVCMWRQSIQSGGLVILSILHCPTCDFTWRPVVRPTPLWACHWVLNAYIHEGADRRLDLCPTKHNSHGSRDNKIAGICSVAYVSVCNIKSYVVQNALFITHLNVRAERPRVQRSPCLMGLQQIPNGVGSIQFEDSLPLTGFPDLRRIHRPSHHTSRPESMLATMLSNRSGSCLHYTYPTSSHQRLKPFGSLHFPALVPKRRPCIGR